jgi:hypothetical protein
MAYGWNMFLGTSESVKHLGSQLEKMQLFYLFMNFLIQNNNFFMNFLIQNHLIIMEGGEK